MYAEHSTNVTVARYTPNGDFIASAGWYFLLFLLSIFLWFSWFFLFLKMQLERCAFGLQPRGPAISSNGSISPSVELSATCTLHLIASVSLLLAMEKPSTNKLCIILCILAFPILSIRQFIFGSLVYLSVINRRPVLFSTVVFIELFINSETALYLTPLLIH